ncbi:MAG: NUDIX hydrolase, partial [Desulfomonilia bacterium]|nr:NUDIX hydrolase [Desulfomonilia bacterium]
MKKTRRFCPYCAHRLSRMQIDDKPRDFCCSCETVFYENPLPVASSIVVNENKEILLVKRKNNPHRGMWCLPIGFAESGEDVAQAALRELREEAGLVGEIVRLIDVDTVESEFYGSLAIVTYEVRSTGGDLNPGDDAADARYFPIADMPELAWSSNTKAVQLYREMYRDTWAMQDSFRQIFSEPFPGDLASWSPKKQRALLSDMLVKIIEKERDEITRAWMDAVKSGIPTLLPHLTLLEGVHRLILGCIKGSLQGSRTGFESAPFLSSGHDLAVRGVPLPDMLNALALSRK